MKQIPKKIINILIISILIIIIIFIVIKTEFYLNNKRINKYIKDYNYELAEYNIYTLKTIDNNIETIYQLLYDEYYFTKYTLITTENEITKIKYYYTTDREIIIEYENSTTTNNTFNISVTKATFKNNKLKSCENKTGKNTNCEELISYATNYNNEINNIIETYKINLHFLKIER